jgi:mycothiol synthase
VPHDGPQPRILRVSDFRVRAVTRDDAAAVNDLFAAAEAVDRTDEHYNLDDVLEELDNPMIDPTKDWVLVEHHDRLVATSRLIPRAPADGALSMYVEGTVHPDHRRQGIGSMLVPLMVQRGREYARERGQDLRPVLTGDAPSTNTDLAAVFGRAGLRPVRWSFVMVADLDRADPSDVPGPPAGYTLHTWEGLDPDEIREAHNRAFVGHYGWTPWSAEMWGQWVADSRALRPSLSLVARDREGAIAAYVQSNEFEAVAEATGLRQVYVAKVGTIEEHRRRGLGGVLLRTALERCRQEGFDRATLDVDSENPTSALGIYESAGFQITQRWTSYRSGD